MKKLILKLGLPLSVVVVTIFSVVFSLIMTAIVMYFMNIGEQQASDGYIIAVAVSLIVTPVIMTVVNKLLLQTLELESKLREQASTDYLTQLLNRGEWMDQVERYINLASHSNSPFAIIMLDLDEFKTINDKYGHLIGDRALRLFGETITTVCRASDIAARFGGEEFIILLPNTSEQQALQVTERLHRQTRALVIMDRENIITLTVSIGVGISINEPNTSVTLDTLISRADSALYQAKHKGKNCTVIFQSTTYKLQKD